MKVDKKRQGKGGDAILRKVVPKRISREMIPKWRVPRNLA
jgi:hypothetical protein